MKLLAGLFLIAILFISTMLVVDFNFNREDSYLYNSVKIIEDRDILHYPVIMFEKGLESFKKNYKESIKDGEQITTDTS